MKMKIYLAALSLGLALPSSGFCDDAKCPPHRFRGWLKACLTITCKTGPFCSNPPAAPADSAPAAAPADAAKPDATPPAATPPAATPATPAPTTPAPNKST